IAHLFGYTWATSWLLTELSERVAIRELERLVGLSERRRVRAPPATRRSQDDAISACQSNALIGNLNPARDGRLRERNPRFFHGRKASSSRFVPFSIAEYGIAPMTQNPSSHGIFHGGRCRD